MENLRDVDYVYIMNPLIHNDDTLMISLIMAKRNGERKW